MSSDFTDKRARIDKLVSIIQRRNQFIMNLQHKQTEALSELALLAEVPALKRSKSSIERNTTPIGGNMASLRRSLSSKEQLWKSLEES